MKRLYFLHHFFSFFTNFCLKRKGSFTTFLLHFWSSGCWMQINSLLYFFWLRLLLSIHNGWFHAISSEVQMELSKMWKEVISQLQYSASYWCRRPRLRMYRSVLADGIRMHSAFYTAEVRSYIIVVSDSHLLCKTTIHSSEFPKPGSQVANQLQICADA